jgi:hypothetical protein
MTDQVAVLKAIADDVGDRVNQGYLPKRLTWQTLRSMVCPSIQYPLPSTSISDEESEEITKKLYANLFLPAVPTVTSRVSSNMHPMLFLVLLFPVASIHSSLVK